MREIGAAEAKVRLSELLRDVEQGETFSITRHGKPIARLIPVIPAPEGDSAKRAEAVERFLQQRATWKGTGMSVEEILAARHEGHNR